MFLRRLTGFSRIHGGISKGALEGSSNTNLRELEISPHVVSTSLYQPTFTRLVFLSERRTAL